LSRLALRRTVSRLAFSRFVPFTLRLHLRLRIERGVWRLRPWPTFTGKRWSRLLEDRRPLLEVFSDKVAAREHIARIVGDAYLPAQYAVVSDPRELDRDALPREFVIKSNHGSGGVWVVSDAAPPGLTLEMIPGDPVDAPLGPWSRVLVSPAELDWDLMTRTFAHALSQNFGDTYLRWGYRGIEPRVLVEELVTQPDGELPVEHRFYVFDGLPQLIQVESGRFGDHRRRLYLPDWMPFGPEFDYPRDIAAPPPATLAAMIELAERLGDGIDFVRVDLYDAGDRVVVGELTAYPGLGDIELPPEFDLWLGSFWTLP
jgi:hypothetical protein